MAHDVFISYASQDRAIADAVCATLEKAQIRCWYAPRDVVAGESWAAGIVRAIAAGKVMVLIFSQHSNASEHVQREVEQATHYGLALIPFRIEKILPRDELAYFIQSRHWLDAITPPIQRHLDTLAEQVRHYVTLESAGDSKPAAAIDATDARPPATERRFGKFAAAVWGVAIAGAIAVGWHFHATRQPSVSRNDKIEKRGSPTPVPGPISSPVADLNLATPQKAALTFLNAFMIGDGQTARRACLGSDQDFAALNEVLAAATALHDMADVWHARFNTRIVVGDLLPLTADDFAAANFKIENSRAYAPGIALEQVGPNWKVDVHSLAILNGQLHDPGDAKVLTEIDIVTSALKLGRIANLKELQAAIDTQPRIGTRGEGRFSNLEVGLLETDPATGRPQMRLADGSIIRHADKH